jgi:RHS repeat-associated protein
LTTTDPLGRTTTVVYDGADLASATDALGRQVQYTTDSAGRVTATFDALGNRTLFDRDDLNRLVSSTDAMGGVTSFTYDPTGRLLTYTDANGRSAGYSYNNIGKVQSFWDAANKWETRLYEPGGLVKQFIDRRGLLRSVTYDRIGRVKTVSFGATAANPTAYVSRIENTWDAGNRLIQITDRTCADPLNNLDCSSVASTTVITRTYNDLDHLVSEVTPQGEIDYTYDAGGRRTSMTIKNGPPGSQIAQPVITYSYDANSRLIGIHQAAGSINGGQPQDIAFAYDAVGQWTQTTLANGSTIAYGHDDGGQLTSITYKKADGSLIGDLQYAYDAGGHRITMSGSLARMEVPASDITDATYDVSNRLLTWNGQSYSYDDDGNLIGDGTNSYQWSERNRLASISNATNTVASFQYDALGRRVAKTVGGVTTGFLYDRKNVAQELAGADSAAAVTAHLVAAGIDATFLRIEGNDGSALRSVLSDANSNTVMLLDAAQQAVVSYSYGPYGDVAADASTSNSQQYAGRDNDNPGIPQGLYYYRARYYMPGIARFISEDPIGWTSGQTNNYAYVGGNPINFRDPLGLDAADDVENFSAGFGDALTFGFTRWLRGKLGIDGVNTCSGWYAGGAVTGAVVLVVATAGAGAEAEAAADGLEALGEEEAIAEGAAAEGAESAPNAIDPNKLNHIFGKATHNLGPLLEEFGGSQQAAFNAVQSAAQAAAGGLKGVFEIVVSVGGKLVTVRGRIIDGIARIGSFWIP